MKSWVIIHLAPGAAAAYITDVGIGKFLQVSGSSLPSGCICLGQCLSLLCGHIRAGVVRGDAVICTCIVLQSRIFSICSFLLQVAPL